MNIKLEPLKEKYLPMVRAWRNDESIRQYMYTDHIITEKEHLNWFNKTVGEKGNKHFIFMVDDEPVGYVNIAHINLAFKRAYWGFYLNPFVKPHIATGLLMEFTAIEYAFGELKLRKLCCEVLANNPQVLNMHQKVGFEIEGCLKQHVTKKGEFLDVFTLGLLEHDWVIQFRDLLIKRLNKYVNINLEALTKALKNIE